MTEHAVPGRGGRDQREPGGGGDVQAAAERGTTAPGRALPYASEIQRAFGRHNIQNVQAHVGKEATAASHTVGAEAFAAGEHIVLAGTPTLHLVAHEAAHVVQQRAGVSLLGGIGKAGDSHERHAERVADLVVKGESAEAALDEYGPARAPASSAGGVQRTLKVGTQLAPTDHTKPLPTDDVNAEVLAVWGHIQTELTAKGDTPENRALIAALNANLAGIQGQLTKWIEDKPGQADAGSHPVFGRKKQNRHYADYYSLAQGALGWVKSKPGRHNEKLLAQATYQNKVLDVYFSSLLYKTAQKIHNLHLLDANVDQARRDTIVAELSDGQSRVAGPKHGHEIGHYRHFFDHHPKAAQVGTQIAAGNMYNVLLNGQGFDTKNKVIVFHDLMEYFGNPRNWITPGHGAGLLAEPGADKSQATTAIDHTGARTASTGDRGMAWPPNFNNATRNEGEAGTKLARQHDVPLWAGQSMTTVRVENLAEWVGASKAEKTALAWGIFAFWRNDYDHTSEFAYHTLHEVMDMSANFGVDYNMLNPGAGLAAFTLPNMIAEMRQTFGALSLDGRNLLAQLPGLVAHPQYAAAQNELGRVTTELGQANTKFQAAATLPNDDAKVAAAHPIMQHMTHAQIALTHAHQLLGV